MVIAHSSFIWGTAGIPLFFSIAERRHPGKRPGWHLIQGIGVLGKQLRHSLRRGGTGSKLRVPLQKIPGGGLGLLQQGSVTADVRHPQSRRCPKKSPGPRSRRSSSAMRKPSVVLVMTRRRWRVSSLRLSEIRMQ